MVWKPVFANDRELVGTKKSDEFPDAVQTWLDQWQQPSPALLRYTGLACVASLRNVHQPLAPGSSRSARLAAASASARLS